MAKDDPIIRSAPRRPEESTDLEKRRRLLACPTDILGIVGFGLYLAWFYLVMSCSITSGAGISHAAGSLLVAAFLLGESLAAIVIASSARRLASRKAIKAIVVASAILLAAPEITVLLTDAEIPLFATWFLSGFGAVLLLSLWGVFLSKLAHLQACGYTSVSALVAVSVLGFTRICLKPYMISVGGLLIVLASLGLFAGWALSARSTGGIALSENTRPPDWGALLHSAGAMVANSFLLGFGFYALSISASFGTVAVIGGMLAGSLFKVVDVRTGIRYQVDKIIKAIAPVAATCLLLLPFVSVEFRFALLFLMAAFATIHEVICWAAVAEYMHIHEVQPFANMAFGRFGDIVGLFLGFVSASAIFGPTLEGDLQPSIFLCIVTLLFVYVQSFFFRDNYTPFVEHKEMDEDLDLSSEPKGREDHPTAWIDRCKRFASCYDLTPRQTEVLLLLAKGYSTVSIEKKLVVTTHTVKAHIYGIYQKVDVHSRQELIDRIEAFECGVPVQEKG